MNREAEAAFREFKLNILPSGSPCLAYVSGAGRAGGGKHNRQGSLAHGYAAMGDCDRAPALLEQPLHGMMPG